MTYSLEMLSPACSIFIIEGTLLKGKICKNHCLPKTHLYQGGKYVQKQQCYVEDLQEWRDRIPVPQDHLIKDRKVSNTYLGPLWAPECL